MLIEEGSKSRKSVVECRRVYRRLTDYWSVPFIDNNGSKSEPHTFWILLDKFKVFFAAAVSIAFSVVTFDP